MPFDPGRLKAVLLDVDGTLYRQFPVRRGMLWRLLGCLARTPGRGWQTLRALRAFRNAQEALRESPAQTDLAEAQLLLAAAATGIHVESVRECVTRWMEQEPLNLVAGAAHPGMRSFLQAAADRGMRLAAVSDYPTAAKLAALGAESFFAVQVCAQDAEVQAFKPNPRGLHVALRRLGVANDEALYVGDRPEVDAEAAQRAGLACVILGRRRRPVGQTWLSVADYQELTDVVCGRINR